MKILIALCCLMLVACDIEPTETITECTESHTEVQMGPEYNCLPYSGISLGGEGKNVCQLRIVIRNVTICDKHITRHNPAHDAWLDRQKAIASKTH